MRESPALHWLRGQGFRITRARRAIATALFAARVPLTLGEIHRKAPDADFTTVFRFLQTTVTRGLVRLHPWDDGQVRYELVHAGKSGTHGHHRHHLVCRGCRRIEEIDTCLLETWQKQLADGLGYSALDHHLEFVGTCPRCQRRPARKTRVPA